MNSAEAIEAAEKKISVLTLNTWTDPHQLVSRTASIAELITQLQPDVAVLQEVFSSGAQQVLRDALEDDYIIIASNHTTDRLRLTWWGSLVPAAVVACSSTYFDSSLGTLLILMSVFLVPWVCVRVVQALLLEKMHRKAFGRPGLAWHWMAQLVLLKKSRFHSADAVMVKPFEDIGYPRPSSVAGWPFWWFQMSCLRPGFMVVRCYGRTYDVTLAACHLVLGHGNPARTRQLQEVEEVVKLVSSVGDRKIQLLCGDLNVPAHQCDAAELEWLRAQGWRDTAHEHCERTGSSGEEYHTWEHANPFTRRTQPADEDARIDYCWVRGQYAKTVAVCDVQIVANEAPYLSDHYGLLANLDVAVDPAFSEE